MDPSLLVCEGSPSALQMNRLVNDEVGESVPLNRESPGVEQQKSNRKQRSYNSLVISVLRKKISALSRLKYGFDRRTRCQVLSSCDALKAKGRATLQI